MAVPGPTVGESGDLAAPVIDLTVLGIAPSLAARRPTDVW